MGAGPLIEYRGKTHNERIEIAKRLHQKILAAYADAVLAILVTSSTARGLDLPYSDLELTAVVRDGTEIPDRSYYYRGLLIEISYSEESSLLRDERRVKADWPVVADGYRNIIVLFERDEWTRRLREALDDRDASDFSGGISHAVTTMLEERDKVRNARLEGDRLVMKALAADVAHWATNVVLFLNRRSMVTTRWFYRRAFECPEQPAGFRRSVEILRGIVPASDDEIFAACERLSGDLERMAAARGITVESETLLV